MTVDFSIAEVENLLMMADHCKRHFDHEYARNAVAKLQAARKEYFGLFAAIEENREEDETK
jgi:hypothetical protein